MAASNTKLMEVLNMALHIRASYRDLARSRRPERILIDIV
jgi:hypothetical protein